MEAIGKCVGLSRSMDGKHILITFQLEGDSMVQDIIDQERLRIKAVRYRQKRSLDANSYAWVLMTKIADVVGSSKDEVYEQMLQKYGVNYEDEEGHIVITVKTSVDMRKLDGHWRFVQSNGIFSSYLMIKGSSEYDSTEMSHFVDRIIEEAKELGIETATPDELARMKQERGI